MNQPFHILFARWFAASAVVCCAVSPAMAIDEQRVLAAIERGRESLLACIAEDDVVTYYERKEEAETRTVRGKVTSSGGGNIAIRTNDGRTIRIPHQDMLLWVKPGMVNAEMSGNFYAGPSTLVAFALATAGVETNEPRFARMLKRLEGTGKQSGTYVHSLRALLWSELSQRRLGNMRQARYRRLLKEDARWLMRAMHADGGYGYDLKAEGAWDHSNTQFANFGLWGAAVSQTEVADRHWRTMGRHWLESQRPDGGWTYRDATGKATPSMTVAGCNSLYIVLDRFYAKADGRYVPLEGAKPRPVTRAAIRDINRVIDTADAFLARNPPRVSDNNGYELFGLERLGIASGRAFIGGRDWFRHDADAVASKSWGTDPIADSYALVFLVHGLAPVLVQKLEHGEEIDDWNYYHRDLAGLTRYISRTFERIYRWQRIPQDAPLRDFQDAPILFIAGDDTLKLPDATRARIREYIDRGGVVFLHADRASDAFTSTARVLFERMFSDEGLRFKHLPKDHPVFRCHFDESLKKPAETLRIEGLNGGSRICVFLCPVDIAGAWHQELTERHEPLFQILANIRMYCAPPYTQLPTRIRVDPLARPRAARIGELSLRRIPLGPASRAHPGAWSRYADKLEHLNGLRLRVIAEDTLPPTLPAAGTAPDSIWHLALKDTIDLSDDARAAIEAYLRSGGLLLIDAADGRRAGVAAVRDFASQLRIGDKGILSADHPIVAGAFSGGRPLADLETTRAGAGLRRGNDPPPIITRSIDGRVSVLACPFDLIAGIDGHFIYDRSGYSTASTELLVNNILFWRLSEAAAHD